MGNQIYKEPASCLQPSHGPRTEACTQRVSIEGREGKHSGHKQEKVTAPWRINYSAQNGLDEATKSHSLDPS